MRISSVQFQKHHKDMLMFLKMCLDKGYLGVPPEFTECIEFLSTAKDQDGSLIKKGGIVSYYHLGDGLRLSLKGAVFDD